MAIDSRVLFILVVSLFCCAGVDAWDNEYDGRLYDVCPNGFYYSSIHSVHHNHYEDRQWLFGCKRGSTRRSYCYWTGTVNVYDNYLYFRCRSGYAVAGAESRHSDKYEDRIWEFRCCKPSGLSCSTSDYRSQKINSFDEDMYYRAPSDKYIVGLSSYHDNGREDRKWTVTTAAVTCR